MTYVAFKAKYTEGGGEFTFLGLACTVHRAAEFIPRNYVEGGRGRLNYIPVSSREHVAAYFLGDPKPVAVTVYFVEVFP